MFRYLLYWYICVNANTTIIKQNNISARQNAADKQGNHLNLKSNEITGKHRLEIVNRLKAVFNNPKHIAGKFTQIIVDSPSTFNTAKPLLQVGKELYGLFEIRFRHPCQFKFKYIHPAILQVVKKTDSIIYYKKGQTVAQSGDGVITRTPDSTPAKKLPPNFSFAILLENRKWIDQLNIQGIWEDKDFIKIKAVLPKIKHPLELVWSKENSVLISWSFYDHKNKLNQIRFYPTAIGSCIPMYKVD